MLKGDSVRNLFRHTLESSNPDICIIPEWICQCMADSVIDAGCHLEFFRVKNYSESRCFLENDWRYLESELDKFISQKCKIVLLLAVPYGYIDPYVEIFLKKYHRKIHIHLDLAQGYGAYDFSEMLSFCECAYFSFNGNKLIKTGGACAIYDASKFDYPLFCKAAENEKKLFLKLKEGIFEKYHLIELFLSNTRSNVLRTVIKSSSFDNILENKKIGQKLLTAPNYKYIKASENYNSWVSSCFLLFDTIRSQTSCDAEGY